MYIHYHNLEQLLMANKIENSSKNINPRINLNHNIYMHIHSYSSNGFSWKSLVPEWANTVNDVLT